MLIFNARSWRVAQICSSSNESNSKNSHLFRLCPSSWLWAKWQGPAQLQCWSAQDITSKRPASDELHELVIRDRLWSMWNTNRSPRVARLAEKKKSRRRWDKIKNYEIWQIFSQSNCNYEWYVVSLRTKTHNHTEMNSIFWSKYILIFPD